MENIGINEMKKELIKRNPSAKFDVRDYTVSPVIIIYGNIPGENLSLPEGYYYNQKNGITNKHNTSGIYESFSYEYDVNHFVSQPKPLPKPEIKIKKSWFSRIFKK